MGGFIWRPVTSLLRAAGHEVFATTLTGLGERAHLASPASIWPRIFRISWGAGVGELGDQRLAVCQRGLRCGGTGANTPLRLGQWI